MSERRLPLQKRFNPVVAAGVPATSLLRSTSSVLLVKRPLLTTFRRGQLQEFNPWVVCSSSLVGPSELYDRSVSVKHPAMNQSSTPVFKATKFSSPPRCWSAQSASHRQNGAVRSDRVRNGGPCVDALRWRDVQTGRKDVVRQLHRLADALFVRWRRLGRKEEKICSIFFLLFQVCFF